MKFFIFIVIVYTIFSCVPKKKPSENNSSTKLEKLPETSQITFSEEFYDFGTLTSGEIVVYTFVFTNSGGHDLLINKIEIDCGCVHAKFPDTPVKPGEKGLIEVEFDSSGLFGKQFKSIEIHANFKEPKHLTIFATVKNENLEIKY